MESPWLVVTLLSASAPGAPESASHANRMATSAMLVQAAALCLAIASALLQHLDEYFSTGVRTRHLAGKGDAAPVKPRAAPQPETESEAIHRRHARLVGRLPREHAGVGQ